MISRFLYYLQPVDYGYKLVYILKPFLTHLRLNQQLKRTVKPKPNFGLHNKFTHIKSPFTPFAKTRAFSPPARILTKEQHHSKDINGSSRGHSAGQDRCFARTKLHVLICQFRCPGKSWKVVNSRGIRSFSLGSSSYEIGTETMQ